MGKFQCTRCGGCCKSLLNGTSGHLFGPYLDPSEVGRFPADSVFPLLGTGDPVQVTAYQLGVNRCPHFQESPGGVGHCGIHATRPVVCRAFPVLSRFSISDHCLAVRKHPEGIDRDSLENELLAHDEKIGQMLDRPRADWVWPLDVRQWIPLENTNHDRTQPVHSPEARRPDSRGSDR